MTEACFDVRSLAKWLGVSERQVRDLCREGKLPVLRVGGALRFPRAMIAQWVEDNTRLEQRKPE
jgi:excisionase family DNA binding protein